MCKAVNTQYRHVASHFKNTTKIIIHTAPLNSVSGFLWEHVPTQLLQSLLTETLLFWQCSLGLDLREWFLSVSH